jgi:hypothetical protein
MEKLKKRMKAMVYISNLIEEPNPNPSNLYFHGALLLIFDEEMLYL